MLQSLKCRDCFKCGLASNSFRNHGSNAHIPSSLLLCLVLSLFVKRLIKEGNDTLVYLIESEKVINCEASMPRS